MIIKRILKEEETPKSITPKLIIKFISNIKNEMDDGITYDRDIFKKIYNKYTCITVEGEKNVWTLPDDMEICNFYRI